MSFLSAQQFLSELDLSMPERGNKTWTMYRKAREILENNVQLWDPDKQKLWESFDTKAEACEWLIEYDQREQDLWEKLSAQPTETLRGSLENLESIIEALPLFDDYQERQMLLLYSEAIRAELEERAKAEADPEYRQEREAFLEAEARRKKAKREAGEYLARTKPRAS